MADRVFDSLSKFSKNALIVWEDEEKLQRQLRKARKEGDVLLTAMEPKKIKPQKQSMGKKQVLPSNRGAPGAATDLARLKPSHSPTLLRSKSAGNDDDDENNEEVRSRRELANSSDFSAYWNDDNDDEAHVFSSAQRIDWSTTFHHRHFEAKKQERIRRLESLRLQREHREEAVKRDTEIEFERKQQCAYEMKVEAIQSATEHLAQELRLLEEQQAALRRRGLERVRDKVHASLLMQCGETTPLRGETVRLLPVSIVEEVFGSYGIVCPHELWRWSRESGFVVDLKPYRDSDTSSRYPLRHGGPKSQRARSTTPLTPSSSNQHVGDTNTLFGTTSLPNLSIPETPKPLNCGVTNAPHDYIVVVRFGSVAEETSQLFELFASCLELAPDPCGVAAPLVLTSEGQYLELVNLDVCVEIVADAAVLTHSTTWVAPRALQQDPSTSFLDIALIAPLIDNGSLLSVSVDVGDSKLRSVNLDENDGQELERNCQKSRQFRLQQQMQRLSSVTATNTAGAPAQSAAPLTVATPMTAGSIALQTMYSSSEADPMRFVDEEISSALLPAGVRALGVWRDSFSTELDQPMPQLSVPLQSSEPHSPTFGVNSQTAADPASTPPSPSAAMPADARVPYVRGTLIPLKQHKVTELVKVVVVYELVGLQTQRHAALSLRPTGLSDLNETEKTLITEPVIDFRFPCKYPDACLNNKVGRNFETFSRFSVCVVGLPHKRCRLSSYPATRVDPHAYTNPSLGKGQTCVLLAPQAEPWRNGDIRVQLGVQPVPGGQNLDIDVVALHEPSPSIQGDMILVFAMGPEIEASDVAVRRIVCCLVDMRHEQLSPATAQGAYALESIYHALVSLMESLDVDDILSISTLQNNIATQAEEWSHVAAFDDAVDSSLDHGAQLLVAGRSHSISNTPRTGRDSISGAKSHRSSNQQSHAGFHSAALWWRKQHYSHGGGKFFRERVMEYLFKSMHRTHVHCRGSIQPAFDLRNASGMSPSSVASLNPLSDETAAWLKHHTSLIASVPPETGKDDAKEILVFTATSLDTAAQEHVALFQHISSHTGIKVHPVVLTSHERSSISRSTDATALLWQSIAARTKGCFILLHPGCTFRQRMLCFLASLAHYVSSDVDLYVPSSNDVSLLSPMGNMCGKGLTALCGFATYSSGGVSAPPLATAQALATAAATMTATQLETVTVTVRLSKHRKLTKRAVLSKTPSGVLTNLLANRLMMSECCHAWFSKLLVAAIDHRQQGLSGSSSLPPIAPFVPGSTFVDVVEVSCRTNRRLHNGPFGEVEAVEYQQANRKKGVPPATGHATSMYLFHVLTGGAGSQGNRGGATGADGERSTSSGGPKAAVPPLFLCPPAPLVSLLPQGVKSWREYAKQKCTAQLLEMGIFFRCSCDLGEIQSNLSKCGYKEPMSVNLLRWTLRERELLDVRCTELVAEESAVRGEHEFAEWTEFLETARVFHTERVAVQTLQLSLMRVACEIEEEERLSRLGIGKDETDAWQALDSSTVGERQALRRINKNALESRLGITYDEADERLEFENVVDTISAVVTLSLEHVRQHASGNANSNPPTAADIDLMFSALDRFAKDVDIISLVAAALVTFVSHAACGQLVGKQGGVVKIKALLKMHAKNESVVGNLLLAIVHLAQVHTNQGKLEQSNIAVDILHAMVEHESHFGIQYHGVRCLAALAKLTQAFRHSIIASSEGLTAMVERFPMLMHYRDYCFAALSLFHSLVAETTAHHIVAELCLPHAICSVLVIHRRDAKLEALLLRIMRGVCSSRALRILVAMNTAPTRFIQDILLQSTAELEAAVSAVEHSTAPAAAVTKSTVVLQSLLPEALRTIDKMCGNTADYPSAHLAACFVAPLVHIDRLVKKYEHVGPRVMQLLKSILNRFTLVDTAWMEEAVLYDATLQPLYKPWQQLELDLDTDNSYGSYPHPLACCYGNVRKAKLHIGNQTVHCMVRLFSNFELKERIVRLVPPTTTAIPSADDGDTVLAATDVTKEKSIRLDDESFRRLLALCRCALSLQMQDALENSLVVAPHQIRCLGFSSFRDIHATIYPCPPRYSLRMLLRGLHEHRQRPMLYRSWLRLTVSLMEVLIYYSSCRMVHGNISLDNIYTDDDVSVGDSPTFVVGPSAAIPHDVVPLVPPETEQQMFTKDEFCEAAARTALDDDRDARRCLLEALQYGFEVDDADEIDMVLKKIPSEISQMVFSLKASDGGDDGPVFSYSLDAVRNAVNSLLFDGLASSSRKLMAVIPFPNGEMGEST